MTASLDIRYRFHFADNPPADILFSLDPGTLLFRAPILGNLPKWAALSWGRCPNCTLDARIHRFCPSAARLVEPLAAFSRIPSFARMRVEVQAQDRVMSKLCSAQEGLSSLFGICMTASGCPLLRCLRPMVRFHLPFASREETVFRAAATWLVGQYLFAPANPDGTRSVSLDGLSERYRQIAIVNRAFSRRIQSAAEMDAGLNAIVILDCFAQEAPLSIENGLEELKPIFSAWSD